jgi:hypothetical protein
MSAWIISLPFLIGIAITIAIMIATGIGSYALVRRIPADESDESAIRVSDHIRRVVGMLLGLMLSTVFAFSSAQSRKIQDTVEVEAAQLADLHHDLSRIEVEDSAAVGDLVSEYLEAVVREEWPSLAAGQASDTTNRMFLLIEDRLLSLPAETEYDRQLKSRLLEDIDEISDLRQARVYSAGEGLDWYILLVILAFGLLMATFRFYPATRWTRFYFISYAVLIGIVLYSTVALNYPFQGGRVSPRPFESLAESIADDSGRSEAPPNQK